MQIKIIQGGMGIGVSLGKLAGAVAKCGGMGVVSSVNAGLHEKDFATNPTCANARAFRNEIRRAKKIAGGSGSIAVNIMVATTSCDEMYQIAVEEQVDAIISGAGLPTNLPEYTKGSKTLAAPIVSSGKAARLLCKLWDRNYGLVPDFFILEGFKAGGHLGFKREEIEDQTVKNLKQLLKEVLEAIKPFEENYNRKIPVYVAGGIFDGSDMAHYIKLGASGVQIATRFIATNECDASIEYKQIMVRAKEEDIVIVKSPVGMPGRALKSPLIEKLEKGKKVLSSNCNNCIKTCPKGLKTPYCISEALIDAANGIWETGLFFCGANVGKVKEILSVKELMDQIMNGYRKGNKAMKIAFLYAGQGSQKVGMGMDFYEKNAAYHTLVEKIGLKYKTLMFDGPMEELSLTRNTQPCMAIFAAGITNMLYEKGIKPDYLAGLSLGEYSALYAAGVFDEKTLVDIVAFRGMEMEKAAQGISCKMTAVLGANREKLEDLCKEIEGSNKGYVTIANYNCPGQNVICGEKEAVEEVEELALEEGAKRCIPLKVSGPFHTKYMKAAGDALKKKFENVSFGEANIPVVFNATGKKKAKNETIEELLEKQVQSSVYFEDCIRTLLAEGVDTVIEIGPGKVLSGFVKKISHEVTIVHIETLDDFESVVKKMEEI